MGAVGEGFHNYHHTFPYDYAASEYGSGYFNPSKAFIDFMALIGQAYDLRKVNPEMIAQRRARTGDLAPPQATTQHNTEHEHEY